MSNDMRRIDMGTLNALHEWCTKAGVGKEHFDSLAAIVSTPIAVEGAIPMTDEKLVEAGFSSRVREHFAYDPYTGVIRWAKNWKGMYSRALGKPAFCTKNSHGYLHGRFDNRLLKAHRVAWFLYTGAWPIHIIDHIDGDKTNNRYDNLRIATYSQNGLNRKIASNNSTGATGVFRRPSGRYAAEVKINGKKRVLGTFDTIEAASRAYKAAVAENMPAVRALRPAGEPEEWRELALQFDGHRIEALAMLRYVSEAANQHEATGRIGEIRAFLAKPPLSGEEVLAQRLAALASPIIDSKVAGPVVKALEWNGSRAESICGNYYIEANGASVWTWYLYDRSRRIGYIFATPDEAKAAAQADYEARILGALASIDAGGKL